ncbi:MAG: hypothetical protein R3F62_01335 [Planctomycetota bacterium]
MNRVLSSLALACTVCAVVAAQERDQVRKFSSFDPDPVNGGGTVVFADGTRFGVSQEIYERFQATFSELTSGDKVRYSIDSRGLLKSISRDQGTLGLAEKRVVSGTFQGREGPIQNHYWITVDAQNYRIPEEVYLQRNMKGVLYILKPGQRVRMLCDGSTVLDLARGRLEDVIEGELWETIARSSADDTVIVNDTAYSFVKADLHGVTVTALGETDERMIRLEEIKTFENRAALDRSQGEADPTLSGDAFDSTGVQVGDTIGIGLDVGQLTELTPTSCTLRVWRNERWADTRTWERSEVTSVRWVSLTTNLTYPIQGGSVLLRVQRRRAARDGGLEFTVEISHDLPNTLLADAKVRLNLGKSGLDVDSTPLKTVELEVPTLFVGDRVQLEHEVKDDALVDGYAKLVADESNMRPLTSDEARGYIQQALERAKDDLNALARIYAAAASNGDETLVGMLIDRALYPVHGPSDADLARVALRGIAPQALERILAELNLKEHELQRTVFREGKLRQVPLARLDTKAEDHKRKLIELMSQLPGGLREKAAHRLFSLHSRVDLRESVEAAFASDPAAAVDSLLKIATAPPTDADARSEAERAGKLLERLADSVLEELIRELRRRGIDVTDLVNLEQAPDTEKSAVVSAALRLLAEDAKKAHIRALELRFEEAKGKARNGDWASALELIQQVLEQQPKHVEARKLLPQALIAVGDQHATEGRRGRAAQLYEEALNAGPEGQLAKPKLAQIYLEVANEELEGPAIRRMPRDSASRIRVAQAGEQVTGRETEDGNWVKIELPDDEKAYVSKSEVTPAGGPTSWSIKAEDPSRDEIERILERAKTLDPSVASQTTQIEGSLLLRDAVQRYQNEDYLGALELFERGQVLVPNDPRLETLFWCKVQAYKVFLIAAGVVLLLILGFFVLRLIQRPKKIKLDGGFQHYGRDRTKRERDVSIEDSGEIPPPAEDA